jgi:anti-sigma-K factor RskA
MTYPDTPIAAPASHAATESPTSTPVRTGVSAWWRAATVFLAILLCIGLAAAMSMFAQFEAQIQHMQAQLKTVQQIKYISILADDKGAPAMLVTLDPQDHTLQLQRLNAVVEGQDDTMQLWALSATGRPVSLGTLTSKIKTQRLNASDSDLARVTQLAISVENKGGVDPAQGPRLPYLFQGAVVQKAR